MSLEYSIACLRGRMTTGLFRFTAARPTGGHANEFPRKRKRAQRSAGPPAPATGVHAGQHAITPENKWLIETWLGGTKFACVAQITHIRINPVSPARSFVSQSWRAAPRSDAFVRAAPGMPPATNLHSRRCSAHRIVRDDRSGSLMHGPGPARWRTFVLHRACEGCGSGGASPSQADDIGAHRQQNGDAYGDNDQEEFSHCSASRRPNAEQQE